ncbi:MAG TPA: mechanosensitive ion channel family protein [Bacteroidales bacterium]|jgi:small conductance mechanosensitive channel|nr:mechanosensitive ion channel family protein [Bacteroidales bacterium]
MEENIVKWTEKIIPWLLDHGIRIILIAFVAYVLNILLRRIATRAIRIAVVADETMSREAEKKREDTLIHISDGAIRVALIIIAFLMILQEAGIEIGPILAGAGIVGLAVGFGAQYLIKDIITGLFIILENQYRIGDVIRIDSTEGTVEKITMRLTTLRDMSGTVHHIPHGEIKRVSNLSKTFARVNLDIGISYSANLEKVIDVINRTGEELSRDPAFRDAILSPPKFLRVNDFASSSVIIKILGDTKPLRQWEVMGELRKRLKIAFDREGIEIPFPQVVVHRPEE